MKEVVITIGPRYSGISTFCNKVVGTHPEITLVATENHSPPTEEAYDAVQKLLEDQGNQRIILDCWNETADDRRQIIDRLKFFNPGCRIGGWVFVTPKSTCAEWHAQAKMAQGVKGEDLARSAIAYHAQYDRFHKNRPYALEGFTFLIQVNALKLPCFNNIFTELIDGPYIPLSSFKKR